MKEIEITVIVGKKKKVFRVPVRYAKVVVGWRILDGAEAYPGHQANVTLDFWLTEESEVERARLRVIVSGEQGRVMERIVEAEKGAKTRLTLRLPPGKYRLRAVILEPKVLEGRHAKLVGGHEFVVREKHPDVSLTTEGRLAYPVGGSLLVRAAPIPSNISVTSVHLGAVGCERYGEVWSCAIQELPRTPERYERDNGTMLPLIAVVTLGWKGRSWRVTKQVLLPVELDQMYAKSLDERIQSLVREALTRESPQSIHEYIRKAQELLSECQMASFIGGYDCTRLSEVLSMLEEEAKSIDAVPERIQSLIGKERLLEALDLYMEHWRNCHTPRYEESKGCDSKLLASLGRELLEKAASTAEKLVNDGEIGLAHDLTGKALGVCRLEIQGTGRSCGLLERLGVLATDIVGFLANGLKVKLPKRVPGKRVRAKITIEYNGTNIIQGAFIDFTPSEDYFLPGEGGYIFRLPRIYPGTRLETSTSFTAKFQGRLTMPYKKCYGKYCVDEMAYVMVGSTVGEITLTIDRANYVGKPVTQLRKYNPRPINPTPIPVEIRVAGYVCTGRLGEGGFAVTLYCHDPEHPVRRVVAKIPEEYYKRLLEGVDIVPPTEGPEDGHAGRKRLNEELRAFDREARILSRLDHPNIIKLLDQGTEPIPYLLFNLCAYGDLNSSVLKHMPQHPLDVDTALSIMIPIADALDHGHRNRVLHLDVKPSNILVDERLIPLLSDYNIGHIMKTISRSSRRKGHTYGFAAPEQVNNAMERPDHRADIFSHAATLYYLITRRHPYPRKYWEDSFKDQNVSPDKPSKYNKNIPEELETVLLTALQVNPDDRYETTTSYLHDLIQAHQAIKESLEY